MKKVHTATYWTERECVVSWYNQFHGMTSDLHHDAQLIFKTKVIYIIVFSQPFDQII